MPVYFVLLHRNNKQNKTKGTIKRSKKVLAPRFLDVGCA